MVACTEDRFLEDVKHHSMRILKDDGVYRHISFTNNGSGIYRFDLDTWPGGLCITGDCGTYVFRRLDDMFEFFRQPVQQGAAERKGSLTINPDYWGEKLESVGVNGGYTEFDVNVFTSKVTEFLDDWKANEQPTAERAEELWGEIADCVLSRAEEGEIPSYQAIDDFSYDGFRFEDFFDDGGTESFTFHYLWCLYAIVWGIRQYDERPNQGAS